MRVAPVFDMSPKAYYDNRPWMQQTPYDPVLPLSHIPAEACSLQIDHKGRDANLCQAVCRQYASMCCTSNSDRKSCMKDASTAGQLYVDLDYEVMHPLNL